MSITPDDIASNAAGPASASADGQSAAAHSIESQIKAATFKASADAIDGTNPQGGAKSPWNILRPAQVRPQGSV